MIGMSTRAGKEVAFLVVQRRQCSGKGWQGLGGGSPSLYPESTSTGDRKGAGLSKQSEDEKRPGRLVVGKAVA